MIQFDTHVELPIEPILSGMRRAYASALCREGLPEADITIRFVDDEEMRALNARMRNIDHTTDVLSFPAVSYPSGRTASQCPSLLRRARDVETGRPYLGDVAISLPKAQEQGEAYGHGLARELAFLTAHSSLHLMGYDHMTEPDRANMRQMEEIIMKDSGIPLDEELLALALGAMEQSYSPYSKFRVGACIRTSDGRIFTGANIENASFGATICAERAAMCRAVSEGARSFEAIAVAGDAPAWPCGICRQALNEFSNDMYVVVGTKDGILGRAKLTELLPHSFGPNDVIKDGQGS